MASRRSLHSVLQDGEVVQFKHGPNTYQSYFRAGLLISTEDPKKTYTSPTGFANDNSKSSVNGWLHCRVLRDGQWLKLADLPQVSYMLQEIPAPKDGPTIVIKRMPPKQPPTKKALPPVHQHTIIANVLEPAEPAIEVTAVERIRMQPLKVGDQDYWRIDNSVYERKVNGGRGTYIGEWDGVRIQTTN
jgi:hypothetical protein